MTLPATAGAPHDPAAASRRSVADRFEQAAAAHPDRPALVFGSDVVTYGELEARSAAVSAGLAGRGMGAEDLVGLLLPRGVELVVGLLGALRAGSGYLPLDPSLPMGRVADMCRQASAELILSDAALRRAVPPALRRRILTVQTCARSGGSGHRRAAIAPGQRAYVLYTSGSTGHPKGVEVTHGSLASLLDALDEVVAGPVPARVGWNASPSFDASVQQWLRLCRGDTVVLVPDEVRRDPQALAALVAAEHLDELDITPSHTVSLLEHLPRRGRGRPLRLLVGGEAIGPGLWRRLADLREAGVLEPVNLYGPTECTVDTTHTPVDHSGGPHLGGPLPGVRVYLLDAALKPVRSVATGELYVSGSGVSRGYLGMPALTAQRFVPDVIAGDGSRMYRTGDLARIGPDGRLEFLGRRDDQVKLNGYRIELGEVDAVLSRCPGVVQAVAMVRNDMPGGTGLVGYCRMERTADGRAAPFDAGAIQRAAGEYLPAYMVPTVLVPLERLPLTGNGKVDREALPAPSRPARSSAPAAPLTSAERHLAEVWREVLEVDEVGPDDDFFDLGGQSSLAITLVARLRRLTGRPIPMVAVFDHPVLRDLAAHLDGTLGDWTAGQR
ncbi:non-ribosomal peptide synthetase [Streptomyces tuirus]|uniref:Non-ribosomal peptide synthetase n=1 Tax=Streptomyces tuirus TaxID=68278 RepID=A0A941FD49_9ACTN|nr:non-ribosomal peptide synthetase [Streptomyces tuirus]